MFTGLVGTAGLDAGKNTVAAVYGLEDPIEQAIMLAIVFTVTADLPSGIKLLIAGHFFTSEPHFKPYQV